MATDRAATMQTTIQKSLPHKSFAHETAVAPSEQRSGEGERQREHGVLELDHLERQS